MRKQVRRPNDDAKKASHNIPRRVVIAGLDCLNGFWIIVTSQKTDGVISFSTEYKQKICGIQA
jgi:hypothetical protein